MQDLFPYDSVRKNQSDLKERVEQALASEKNVLTHAPTGLGKTAATVAPSLAYALNQDKTVFFLTPRHSQHEIAIETLREIRAKHGTDFVAVDLIGKRHLCEGAIVGGYDEDGNKCPRHDNTYDDKHRLTPKAHAQIRALKGEILRAEEVRERCTKVCPYEILINMAADADIVIGDYFHIFHPKVREVIFSKSSITMDDCIVIGDEAHNLPDRTRNLNSATLTEKMLDAAKKEASEYGHYTLEEHLERFARELGRMAKHELGMDNETEIEKDVLMDRVKNFVKYDDLIDDLDDCAKDVLEEEDDATCRDVAEFFSRWQGTDNGFVRVFKKVQYGSNKPYLKVSYTCLNAQYATKEPLSQAHTAICMSGTLTPIDMYLDIFGLDPENTFCETFESPFPEENKLSLVVDKVTTRYKDRDDDQYQKIAWYVLQSMEQVKGNVGIFFPSYRFRDEIYERIHERTDKPLFKEDRSMDKEAKNAFLAKFAEKSGEGAALFGVIGGSFGEGVDYPGELMSAVFVIGVPLQRPDLETQALIDFYDQKFGRGWDYGYNFPAINRALQAAGRCIRNHEDRGVVVFMDKRYTWSKYLKAMDSEDLKLTKAPWVQIEEFFAE